MTYTITQENFADVYKPELEALMRQHYEEMADRLRKDNIPVSPYNLRVDEYSKSCAEGWLICNILRFDGKAVGYSNIYLTQDMHNQDLIAEEDTLYVVKEHRNGIGRKFVQFMLQDLKSRGVKSATVSARTDLRVAQLWKRMGFKEVAIQMQYTF